MSEVSSLLRTVSEHESSSAREYPRYSVLMAIWKGDSPELLRGAISSMLSQTVTPDEIVIVCDGSITEDLNEVISSFHPSGSKMIIVRLEQNHGLGYALAKGVETCSNEFIARMDADDWSVPDRIERELDCMLQGGSLDVVGSNINEYSNTLDNIVSEAVKPEHHDDIEHFAHRRNPVCHVTLLFRRSSILRVGNYKPFRKAQDYELVARALKSGLRFYNIQEPLVLVNAGDDYYKRRGGMTYLKRIIEVKIEIYKDGFYSLTDLIVGLSAHVISCAMPNGLRKVVYKYVLRRR